MKKLVVLLLAVLLAIAPFTVLAEGVTLTMGSWRNTDAAMVDALLAKYKELTGVTIVFEPTQSSQYNSVLRLQLDSGTGPDLYYSRSYATGEELYTAGFSMDCSDVAGVKDNFAATSLEPWTAADGKLFAVPFAAVSQPIYYNKTIFADNGITELPQTYEEFIAMCQKLKDNGVTVFANGIASNWDILECVLLGLIPNYIDSKGRVAYETKEKKFNDPQFVEILEDFAKLVPFLPESFEAIDNDNANVYFGMGNAAMLIDGSWSCGPLKDEYDTDWGTMTFPAPAGKTAGVCFHPDMGITGNNATKHPEEVKAFLAWLATPEGAQITADYLPAGFFPMINAPITFKNERVTDILALNQGKTLDARFIWPKMMDYYTPMVEQLNAICRGETTPQAAADTLAALQ
ncbi:MAG: ABC transporter substrate-binding protein [Eubacteriales bacterium]|nr:ABC transporter substrate-binding protein [Eubacteriales bacterium]